jgi:3-phenylpropionate/trans-cinnamate dioxygenase ferredoxin reductase subunit
MEVASSAVQRGCEVTVIEAGTQIMGRLVPRGFARTLEDVHRGYGMTIRTETRPVAFVGIGKRVAGVELAGGEVVPAAAVVVGVGVKPRTDLASRAGLVVSDGVVVDEFFRTSDAHIFAAGDVARVFHSLHGRHVRIEQWRPAQDQGRRAAASIMGMGAPYRDTPWMWSDQHDMHIQMAGFGFGDAELVRRGDVGERSGLTYFGICGDRLVAACGVSRGTGIARSIRAAATLIESGASVDVERLPDSNYDLRRLAREHDGKYVGGR